MKCFFILGFTIRNAETIFEVMDREDSMKYRHRLPDSQCLL